jgi:VWFA-related protein
MKDHLLLRATVALLLFAAIIPAPLAQSGRPQPPGPTSPQPKPQRPRPVAPGQEAASAPQGEPKAAADDEATIRVETTLVTIPVSVLDRHGKYIPHLEQRNFRIFEDGIEQEIAEFGTVETPFHVVLLLDTSRSTRFKIEDIQRAAIAFVAELRPEDRVMVVSFDSDVYIDSEFTSDRAQLRRAIYRTRTGGATKLYDAVDLVITERLNQIEGRKAIVLFTDGVDTASKLASARSTAERVEESGALVYPIQYDTEGDLANPPIFGGGRGRGNGPVIIDPWPLPRFPRGRGRRWPFDPLLNQFPRGDSRDEYSRASRYLRELAERSGARLHHADTLGNLSQAFSLIAEEMRHQYALSYYPTNTARDGTYRRIRVQVNQPNLVVRARDGYRAAGGTQAHAGDPSQDDRARPALKRGKQWSGRQ